MKTALICSCTAATHNRSGFGSELGPRHPSLSQGLASGLTDTISARRAAPKAIRSGDLISYHLKHVCTDNRKQELCWKGWNFRKELLKLHLTCVLPGSDSSVIFLVIFCVRSVWLLLRELLVRVRRRTVMLLLLPCCVCCLTSSRPGGGQGRAAAAGAAA
jgi:hypothetical protein